MLHTVFSAECNPIFDWHSVGLFHSHKTSGQAGGITRLLACSGEQLKSYRGLDIGPTFVHHNHRGDEKMNYAAFNKPASVNYWVHSGAVPAGVEYVMQLDADMLIHRPVDPPDFGLKEGVVVSAPYDYLVGTHTALPDVFGVKNKHLQARVGGVHIFHINDLKRIAPLWLNFTERVRDFACRDPERYYELASPDAKRDDHTAVGRGRRRQFMWMVEMYGYVFGAAEAGIAKHNVRTDLMRYTGDVHSPPGPFIIHYGIDWEIKWKDAQQVDRVYSFNKLIYLTLDVASCPRWFMPLAPFSTLDQTPNAERKTYTDALCGKQIADFNEAICGYYQRHCTTPVACPPRDAEVAHRELSEKAGSVCMDLTNNCLAWSRGGECQSNPGFMASECPQSCGKCEAAGVKPYLGDPTVTCFDEDAAAACGGLAAVGACHSQTAYMQERCRRTCEFCNASADAFKDAAQKGKADTAQHQCPDGTDLGGGEVLVESKGAEINAQAASIDDEHATVALELAPDERAIAAARKDAAEARALAARATTAMVAHVESQAATPLPRERREPQLHAHAASAAMHSHSSALDVSLASWPFMLVQAMVLLLAGYMLRGFFDRRAKRRRGMPGRGLGV